jgi:hypothetical protein
MTTTARSYFVTAIGATRARSINFPKLYLASFAETARIRLTLPRQLWPLWPRNTILFSFPFDRFAALLTPFRALIVCAHRTSGLGRKLIKGIERSRYRGGSGALA